MQVKEIHIDETEEEWTTGGKREEYKMEDGEDCAGQTLIRKLHELKIE